MSDYLDGTDAFDRLLDKLLNTHESALRDRSALHEAMARLGQADRQIASLTSAASSLTQEVEAHRLRGATATPIMDELYAAADATIRHLSNPPETDFEGRTAAATRLRTALNAAAPYCDEIPF